MLKFLDNKPVVLGSSSPRRRELFSYLFKDYRSLSPDQELLKNQGDGVDFALNNAIYKSNRLKLYHNIEAWVFCFDTVVALGDRLLAKYEDYNEAKQALLSLSNLTHQVHTGFCLLSPEGEQALAKVYSTDVKFQPLDERLVDHWLSLNKYQDKAGAYAIQDLSCLFISKIDGCYYNVMGLPISAIMQDLLSYKLCEYA